MRNQGKQGVDHCFCIRIFLQLRIVNREILRNLADLIIVAARQIDDRLHEAMMHQSIP